MAARRARRMAILVEERAKRDGITLLEAARLIEAEWVASPPLAKP